MSHQVERALMLVCIASLVGCEGKAPAGLRDGLLELRQVAPGATLTATAASASQVDLAWQDDATNETGWEIDRSPSTNGRFDPIASLGANATTYSDGALAPTTQYCYKVRSFRVVGRKTTYASFTNTPCATTRLNAPADVRATPESSTGIAVTWSAGGAATGYRVERATSGNGPWQVAATTGATAQSYHDTGRTAEQPLCYRVIGLNASGDSAPSNVACTTPPAGPTNLAITTQSTAATLTWQDHSAVEDGYQVQRATDGVTFSVLATLPANSATYRDAAVVVAKSYSYRIGASKDGGRSDFSNVVTVTIPAPQSDPPPNAPSNLAAAPTSSSTIRVAWTDNTSDEDGFHVEQSSTPEGPWTLAGTTAANVTILSLGVPPDQRLCYRVTAFNANGSSPPSTADCSAAPAAPTNLVANAATDGIEITWSDNSAVEFSYVLEISSDGASFAFFQRFEANTTHFHHTGVRPSTTYWYRVRATRDGGTSDVSNTGMSAGACVPTSDIEDCSNGVDDNCDGIADGVDPSCGELVDCNANPCGSGTICNGAYCVSSCNDGFRDSDESDVDCGGGCGQCQVDQSCWGDYDCVTDNCVYVPGAFMGVCKPPIGFSARRLPANSVKHQRPKLKRPTTSTRRIP